MAASNAELAARQERGEDVVIDKRLERDLEGKEREAEGQEGDEGQEGQDEGDESEDGNKNGRQVEMDVGVGVFDVAGEVAGDVGPVVERDAAVWKKE
jgi:hypothetical protein